MKSQGGGHIASVDGLMFKDLDNIVTPIFEEIDFETEPNKKLNTKNLFHINELQHTEGGARFTDLWILDHNSAQADTDTLKA